jgi:cytosine/uracil/thiamine/allantoin permease
VIQPTALATICAMCLELALNWHSEPFLVFEVHNQAMEKYGYYRSLIISIIIIYLLETRSPLNNI